MITVASAAEPLPPAGLENPAPPPTPGNFWRWHGGYWGCYLLLKSSHLMLLLPLQQQPVLPALSSYLLLCLLSLLYTTLLARFALQHPLTVSSWRLAAALLPLLILLLPLRLYLLTRFGNADSASFSAWYHYLLSGIPLLLLPLAGWLALLLLNLQQQRRLVQQQQQQQLYHQAQQAQLKLLRYQSDPHFLFNSLTAINTLIVHQQGERAEHLIQLLTNFLRHSLSVQAKQQVPIGLELNALQGYFAILQHRFGERLQLDWQLDNSVDLPIPPLLLQPLAEQLLEATVVSHKGPCRLQISLRREPPAVVLVFADRDVAPPAPADLAARRCPPARLPAALQQLQQRLTLLYGSGASLYVQSPQFGCYARLQLPGADHG